MNVVNQRLYDLPMTRRGELTTQLEGAFEDETDVVFAYLHGSYGIGVPFHDIDVAVYFRGPGGYARRALDLGAHLSRRFGYPIDVRALNDAPVPFRFRSMQGTLLLSREDGRLADLIEDTGRRYLDLAPLLRRATREAFVR